MNANQEKAAIDPATEKSIRDWVAITNKNISLRGLRYKLREAETAKAKLETEIKRLEAEIEAIEKPLPF